MATNMALKRARKAQRRKLAVSEKRKVEAFESSLAGHVRRATQMPIQQCLLTEGLFEGGIGNLVVTRGPTPRQVILSSFLVDVFCLGVKDVMVASLGPEELAFYVEAMSDAAPFLPVDPSYARKLLRDVTAWAQSLGFSPHRDFWAAEQVFGEVRADACDATFQFGRNGKPLYLPGPTESSTAIRTRLAHLRGTLGDDGFNLNVPAYRELAGSPD